MEGYGSLIFVGAMAVAMCGATAAFFLMVRRKGAAAGGGLEAGFAALQRERWAPYLGLGESIVTAGAAIVSRPAWQLLVARFVPGLRLAWMPRTLELALTDQGRLLVGQWGLLGVMSGLSGQAAYERRFVSVVRREPVQRWAHGFLTPSCGSGDPIRATLRLPDRTLALSSVSASLVSAIAAPR